MYLKALLPAGVVVLLATAPSFGQNQQGQNGQGQNQDGNGNRVSHSAPAPVAALGLPAGVLIGGYIWLRRRTRKS